MPTAINETAAAKAIHPAGAVTNRFFTAVIKGDSNTANSCLTPRALAQFQSLGKTFEPPGLNNATFKIGKVEQPSPTGALVQCDVQAKDRDGNPLDEEMCCLLQLVDNQWRVCGIAYGTEADQIIDFENMTPVKAQVNPTEVVQGNSGAGAPQTAQNPLSTQTR